MTPVHAEQSGGQQCESQTREAAAVATGNCGAVHGWFGVSDGQFRISGSGEAQLANHPPNPRLFVASSPVGIDQKRISGEKISLCPWISVLRFGSSVDFRSSSQFVRGYSLVCPCILSNPRTNQRTSGFQTWICPWTRSTLHGQNDSSAQLHGQTDRGDQRPRTN